MSTPNFGNAVKKFVKAGITPKWLLPIAPVDAIIGRNAVLSEDVLGKAPGRFNERANSWSGLGGKAVVAGITKADFAEMREWPTPNVGILGRAYPGIDSDASNEDARRLVENVLDDVFGKSAIYGERIRGKNPRRLYSFKCVDPNNEQYWVRTRHLTYEYKGAEHKLDIIGYGGQYLISGTHPSGDKYDWRPEFELDRVATELTEIDNADIERFLETFREILEEKGGRIVKASGGRGAGEETDIRELDAVMPVEIVLEGLDQLPNSPETFLHRDDFVSALAAIRSALGKESLKREVEDKIFHWATQDPDWCDEDYFDKIWRSLDRVRVSRDSLDRLFRRNGIRSHVKNTFNDDAGRFSDDIKRVKKKVKDNRATVLDTVAANYIFGHVNTRAGNARYTMRSVWNVDQEWPALDWWKLELAESDIGLLDLLHREDRYLPNKIGLANFLRDLQKQYPDNFYYGETRHPGYDKGEIYKDPQPDGSTRNLVNMRFLSEAIRLANKPDPQPKRSREDVAYILDYGKRLFGDMLKYELDTLAYMAQTGDRPGSLLFLVGDQGVGKSLWLNLQMALFDGLGPEGSAIIDGAKLMNESARRFILARTEGCRIVSIKEMPEGSTPRDMAAITSQLKQVVDPGPEGDFIMIEAKGENAKPVRNFARVLISTNYANAIHVEQQDRRIFYVKSCITLENRPEPEFYTQMVDIIQDPARLQAFFRYLKTRDIGEYNRYTAPPVSSDKAERIVAEIAHPGIRHMRAAIEWLRVSDRQCFDTEELAELMTRCANNEFTNSGGSIDERRDYGATRDGKANLEFMNAIRAIQKQHAVKLEREFRSAKKRYPNIYFLPGNEKLIPDFMEFDRDWVFRAVDTEYDRGVIATHPWAIFRDTK